MFQFLWSDLNPISHTEDISRWPCARVPFASSFCLKLSLHIPISLFDFRIEEQGKAYGNVHSSILPICTQMFNSTSKFTRISNGKGYRLVNGGVVSFNFFNARPRISPRVWDFLTRTLWFDYLYPLHSSEYPLSFRSSDYNKRKFEDLPPASPFLKECFCISIRILFISINPTG